MPEAEAAGQRDEILRQTLVYEGALKAYAFTLLRDWQAVEDAYQETVLAVMEQWQTIDPEGGLHGLLRRIIKNKTIDQLRRRRREAPVLDAALEASVDLAFAEAQHEPPNLSALRAQLRACMATLSRRVAEMVRAFYQHHESYAAIAQGCGIGVEAVRKALFRARRHLQACIRRHAGGK